MKLFTVFNNQKEILRTGSCSKRDFLLQIQQGEYITEGFSDTLTQKVEFDGFDDKGQPINPRVVDKTPEEIETDNPTPPKIPFEKQTANITNKQLQDILNRLNTLET